MTSPGQLYALQVPSTLRNHVNLPLRDGTYRHRLNAQGNSRRRRRLPVRRGFITAMNVWLMNVTNRGYKASAYRPLSSRTWRSDDHFCTLLPGRVAIRPQPIGSLHLEL